MDSIDFSHGQRRQAGRELHIGLLREEGGGREGRGPSASSPGQGLATNCSLITLLCLPQGSQTRSPGREYTRGLRTCYTKNLKIFFLMANADRRP